MSARSARQSSPISLLISRLTKSILSFSISTITGEMPASAYARAYALPMPCPAPVITATLPLKPDIPFSLYYRRLSGMLCFFGEMSPRLWQVD